MPEEKKQDLMIPAENLPEGIEMKAYQELLQENLEGIENPEFPLIKILHAGTLMFQIPPDEDGQVKQIKEFSGIIILHQRVNAYWEKTFAETGGGIIPDCASMDGKNGSVHGDCSKCKFNQFGSDEKETGKACKNMIRVFVRLGSDLLPSLLTIPPTSMREFNNYMVRLLSKKKAAISVVTKFSLIGGKNKAGIDYSKLVCSMEKKTEKQEFAEALVMKTMFTQGMRQRAIDSTEYGSGEEKPKKPEPEKPVKKPKPGEIEAPF